MGIKIGILGAPSLDYAVVNMIRYFATPQILDYGDRRSQIEILVIHGIGVNPLLRTFIFKEGSVIPSIAPDPYVMMMCEYNLGWYLDLEIPIILLGDAAVYGWDLARNKTAVTSKGFHLVPNNTEVTILEGDPPTAFQWNRVYGFLDPTSRLVSATILELVNQIKREINSQQDNITLEPIEQPKTPLKPKFTSKAYLKPD